MSTEATLTTETKSSRLNGKDLINIGLFTVLYFVLVMLGSFIGFVPYLIPALAVVCPLLGGIPYMLFLTRVKKFGMVTIMATLIGFALFLGGMGILALPAGMLFGFIADLYMKTGDYKSVRKGIIGYGIFSMTIIGNYLPIVLNRAAYTENLIAGGYGAEYASTLMMVMPDWILPVLLVVCFVSGIAGGFIGKLALKKHFEKAGMA